MVEGRQRLLGGSNQKANGQIWIGILNTFEGMDQDKALMLKFVRQVTKAQAEAHSKASGERDRVLASSLAESFAKFSIRAVNPLAATGGHPLAVRQAAVKTTRQLSTGESVLSSPGTPSRPRSTRESVLSFLGAPSRPRSTQ